MIEAPPHAAPHGAPAHDAGAHPPAELDEVPSRAIVGVGAAALLIFLVGSLLAGFGMRAVRRSVNPDGDPPLPTEAGKAKIGMVEQRLFEHANQGVAWREHARKRLDNYGWVDQGKGVAHIPIDRAMDMVEKGVRP